MLVSRSFIILAWRLLLASGAEAAVPDASGSVTGVRRIELRADERAAAPEVRIRPGRSTTVFFDSAIVPEHVELEGRERFQRVGIADDHLALIPSDLLRGGERLRLQVRFKDGALPEFASLMLVVDTTQVEHQVELYRRPRMAESYRQEVAELRAGMLRLEQEVERLRETRFPGGIIESLVASVGESEDLGNTRWVYQRMSGPLRAQVLGTRAISLTGTWSALRLSLELKEAEKDWTATGVSLVDAQGRSLEVRPPWQPEPARVGRTQAIVLMLGKAVPLQGTSYTLKLWDEDGRTLIFEGVTVQ